MAWIKAQNGRLINAETIVIDEVVAPREVRGDSSFSRHTLGTYSSNAVAEKVKDGIYAWLNSTGGGVWRMPDKDYLCEIDSFNARRARELRRCSECRSDGKASVCGACSSDTHSHWTPKTVLDVKLPCKFFGGPLDGTTMCVSNASKNVSIPAVADGGLGSWEYERLGGRTDFILKAFPAHDASKPIYGVTDTNLGEKIEFVRGEETLTCKVIKIVRKGTHGIFKTELTKE